MIKIVDYSVHSFLTDPDRVILAFAGGAQDVFQWHRSLSAMGRSHILLRDTTGRCYGSGVTGIGDRGAVLARIADLMNEKEVVTLGTSVGAYGALLYGQLAMVDRVIAISPVSGRETDDFPEALHHRLQGPGAEMDDLRKYFAYGPNQPTTAYVSDGPGTELDLRMAERLGIKDICHVPGYSHADLARGMRNSGMLQQIL